MSIFKTGFNAVKEEKERQDTLREQQGFKLFNFFVQGDGAEADIIFLNDAPVNYYAHTIKKYINGKELYIDELCVGAENGCIHCENGLKNTFKGSFLVIDRREVEFTRAGESVKEKDQLRMYTQGSRVLSQLARNSERYGLTDKVYTVVRIGTGTSTVYSFERGDELVLSEKEITEKFPDKLKEIYDGTEDSLHKIIMEQLKLTIPEESVRAEDDTEEEEEDTSSELISVADETKPKKIAKVTPKESSIKTSVINKIKK